MAATDEMLKIALATRPHAACIVPEKRTERTTEGGLDAAGQREQLAPFVAKLNDAGIRVSLFIAADPAQFEAAAKLRAPVVEIHTGAWCDALLEGHRGQADAEWQRICDGVRMASELGLEVHAGHGLDYTSAETIAALPQIVELNIGHFLVGEAVFNGFGTVIRTMRAAMDRGRLQAKSEPLP
jgi:pyridoxine 5-phosphate synthase